MASEEFVGEGENRQRVQGRILETVRYTAFGVPQVFRRLAADIADDTGVPLDHGQRTNAAVPNSGMNDGDYNLFFAADGFFYQQVLGTAAVGMSCDIADDAGRPLVDGQARGGVDNSGVNEGDYNAFFNDFLSGQRISTEILYSSTDPNSAGSTLYEYGELSFPENNNRIGYCGYWWDPHLQMYLVRNRWYTPREGRWLTPDPIGYAGGRNLYQYCDNQPWLYTDPMGLSYQLYGPLSREQMAQLRQAAPGTRIGERGVTGAVFSGLWQGGYDGLIVTSNVAVNTLTLGHVGMTRRQLEAEGALYDNETPGLGVSETAGKVAGASAFAAITLATFGLGGTAAPGTTYVFTFTEGALVSSVSNAVMQRYEIQNGDRQSFSFTSNVFEAFIGGGLNVAFRAVAPYLEKVVGRMFGRAADDAASATAGKSPTNPAGKGEPCGGCPNAPRIPTIGGRKPINSEYAGKIHPSGVEYSSQGFPIFKPHAIAEVKIPGLTGNYAKDAAMANKALGLNETPAGYVWHHVEDGVTLQLVPRAIHDAARHTGGAAVIRNGRRFDP